MSVMDHQPWEFDDMRARLLSAVEVLNDQIRDIAHAPPSTAARDGGDAGIARWQEEVGQMIGVLEGAKKIILARLGQT